MNPLSEARRVLDIEAQAIRDLSERLDGNFSKALDLICQCQGKVVFSGMGKSGHIARKLASTFSSTGTPGVFLHPGESAHGDLGLIESSDCLVLISYGGEGAELAPLLNFAQKKGLPLIALTGNLKSSLAQRSHVTLNIHVQKEACPLGLAPTASSTVALALGDALAMATLKKKGFTKESFAQFHPGGLLGRRLLTQVKDLMHGASGFAQVHTGEKMIHVVSRMTESQVRGVAAVTDDQGSLVGSITDGDLRRHLEKSLNPLETPLDQIMGKSPKTIGPQDLATRALALMEEKCIQSLFVVEDHGRPVGLIHLQDLIRAKI